jgi:hypothetical protein
MFKLRTLALASAAFFALAAVPAPAGSGANCGLGLTADTAFQRLDRTPSASAVKICAIYLNTFNPKLGY